MTARRGSAVFAAMLALFALASIGESTVADLRYLKYLLPLGAVLLATGATPPEQHDVVTVFIPTLRRLALAIAANSLVVLVHGVPFGRFAAEAYFLIAPLVVVALTFPFARRGSVDTYARAMFLAFACGYFIERGAAILPLFASPSLLLAQFVTSDADAESGASFVFGLFCLYFVMTGRRRAGLLAFVLVVLSFKRIAIAGVGGVVMGFYILRLLRFDARRHRWWIPAAMVAVNAVLLLLTYKLSQGDFDTAIEDATGLSANFLTMGRADIWDLVISRIGFSWFGSGLGTIHDLLRASGLVVDHAHSEILKYTIEVGPLFSMALVYLFYRTTARTTEMLVLALYVNVLFITDNVSIYADFTLMFYLLLGFLWLREPNRSSTL